MHLNGTLKQGGVPCPGAVNAHTFIAAQRYKCKKRREWREIQMNSKGEFPFEKKKTVERKPFLSAGNNFNYSKIKSKFRGSIYGE